MSEIDDHERFFLSHLRRLLNHPFTLGLRRIAFLFQRMEGSEEEATYDRDQDVILDFATKCSLVLSTIFSRIVVTLLLSLVI